MAGFGNFGSVRTKEERGMGHVLGVGVAGHDSRKAHNVASGGIDGGGEFGIKVGWGFWVVRLDLFEEFDWIGCGGGRFVVLIVPFNSWNDISILS